MEYVLSKELVAKILGSRCANKIKTKNAFGYKRIIDRKEYSIYERPIGADKVVAAYNDTLIKKRGDYKLIYIPDARLPWINYRIKLNQHSFPGVHKGSKISQCLLLPYLRNVKPDTYIKDVRLCVFTDKGQIFHNKPSREKIYEGLSRPNDVICFEESVVWDIPGRRFPVKNKMAGEGECYYPGLPDFCYAYSPAAQLDENFKDRYGNGGFGKTRKVIVDNKEVICSRFYIHSQKEESNPFLFIGTGQKNDKMNIIGTYRANVNNGVRICVFATDDGGREWFCKYEFSDFGEYEFQQGYGGKWGTNYGNRISYKIDLNTADERIIIYKRNITLPDSSDGKVNTKFSWIQVSTVKSIKGEDGICVHTNTKHGLKNGNIVALEGDSLSSPHEEWFLCSAVNEQGTNGGQQFKVKVLDDFSFELLELVSSATPTLPCRHIHHINLLKDGWVVGTGEIYPNGWLLYIQQRMADTYSIVSAETPFTVARINTGKDSVQRTMGVIIKDDLNSTMVFASDHDTLERNCVNSTNMKDITRGSLGVYVGHLDDVDNRNLFECVYDAREPCYFFQQIGDLCVFAGQRGELAICSDSNYKKWYQERIDRFIMHYYGQSKSCLVFNDYIIIRK